MKLRSNAKKKLLVNGGILYRRVDKFYPFRCRAIDVDEVFCLIVQTNSIHFGKNKTFTALNQQFFGIKCQEGALLLSTTRPVCISRIYYPTACSPKGYGSGLPLPFRTARPFSRL